MSTAHQTPDWEAPVAKPSPLSRLNPFSLSTKSTPPTYPNSTTVYPAIKDETAVEELGNGTIKRTWKDRYLPHSRKARLYTLAALVAVVVLAIALGVGIGVAHKKSSKKSQNLPLPTSTSIFTGDLTYYSPGPGYGACGYTNTSTESICAVSHLLWDSVSTSSNPNLNPLCGKKIRIQRYVSSVGANRSVDVEVVDRCTGCEATDLDLSLGMFTSLAEEGEGRVVGSWAWLN